MSNIILIANFLLYLITFIFYQRKSSSFQIGSFILLFYSILACGSFFLYNSNSIWTFDEIKIFPFVYLYVALMIFFRPLMKLSNGTANLKLPDSVFMNILSVTIIIIYGLFLIQTLSSSFSFSNMLDPSTLLENYEDKNENVDTGGPMNVFAVLKNIFSDILWIVFMYNWITGKKTLAVGLLISIVISIIGGLAFGSRAILLSTILQIPFAYLMFRSHLSPKQRSTFLISVGSVCGVAVVALSAMTLGRFGDSVRYSMLEIVLYYSSSNFLMFNNFALDAGGCRYGDRTFPLVRVLLGMDTAGDYKTRRMIYSNLKLDDSQFSFFVGEFVLDYGPYIAMLIIVVASIFFCKRLKKVKWDLGDVLLAFFIYRISVDGFTLFPYSEIGGNLRIIYVIIFIMTFKFFTKRKLSCRVKRGVVQE